MIDSYPSVKEAWFDYYYPGDVSAVKMIVLPGVPLQAISVNILAISTYEKRILILLCTGMDESGPQELVATTHQEALQKMHPSWMNILEKECQQLRVLDLSV